MNTVHKNNRLSIYSLVFLVFSTCVASASAMTFSGPIHANAVSVQGSVSVSSITISTLTVTNLLTINGLASGLPGKIVQMKFSSTTVTTTVSTTTYVGVSSMNVSMALSNPLNYVRISVTGMISFSSGGINSSYLTVKRDTTDLGKIDVTGEGTGFAGAVSDVPSGVEVWRPAGVVITDSPGDTSSHTYGVYIRVLREGTAAFPHTAGYLIAEEVSQ